MPDLFPCPNSGCEHWNPVGRKRCFACRQDLSDVDAEKAARSSRPRRGAGGVAAVSVAILVVAAIAWWIARERAVSADSVPPVLSIDEPSSDEVFASGPKLVLKGRVEDDHPDRVEAGGQSARVVDGAFTLTVDVPPQGGTISVRAVDEAGNMSPDRSLTIEVDAEAPRLASVEPADGASVVTPTLVIRGTASEPLTRASVSGTAAETDGAAFSASVELNEGSNTLVVSLTDRAGNTTETSLRVTYSQRRLPAGFSASGRTATGHELFTAAKDGAQLVLIPGGTFTMGSTSGDDDEEPTREVTLTPYFIDRTPITNAQYARYVEDTGASVPPPPDFDREYFRGQPDAPVVMVTWTEARAYAEWAGRVLVTEARWEFAARGPDALTYPWGEERPSGADGRCNLKGDEDGFSHAAPVGRFPDGASPFGVLDMVGNVWEWTADRYGPYPSAGGEVDPTGPARGGERSLRGGAYTSGPDDVRAANRWKKTPGSRLPNGGFRTAVAFPE